MWDEKNGLKVFDFEDELEFPSINNKGQITATNFIWDPVLGTVRITLENVSVKNINENWQGVGCLNTPSGSHAIFWERDKVTDLTEEFLKNVPGDWEWIYANHINNHGHVILNASRRSIHSRKSFLWKDGVFSMILPENPDNINVSCFDDNGNMIVEISGRNNFFRCFMNLSDMAESNPTLVTDEWKIKNNLPFVHYQMPGIIRPALNGNSYFTQGVKIQKLLVEESPFYNVKEFGTVVRDQNSKGHVVGTAETIYPGRHAFIAILQP